MHASTQPYGLYHLVWLSGIAITSILVVSLCRRNLVRQEYVRAALACLLVAGELQRYFKDGVNFPHHLPLNLCNITTWVAVLACIWLYRDAVEFTYFAGFGGAGMALLTPDMGADWPVRFFMNHGTIILTASALVFGRISLLRKGALWRAFGYSLLYLILITIFDFAFKTNYAYARKKPGITTILSILGEWPYYVLGMIAVGFLLYLLLWQPVKPRASDRGPIHAEAPSLASAEAMDTRESTRR